MTPRHPSDSPEFLEVACALGRSITARAVWHEDRCTWVGAMPEEHPAGGVAMTHRTLGPDLYGGTAGVGLFLAELAAVTGEPETRRTALGALRHAASRVDSVPKASRSGLYAGEPGIALALAYAGRLLDEPQITESARVIEGRFSAARPNGEEFDLVSGHAGAVMGLLCLRASEGGDALLDSALAYGELLLATATPEDAGLSWCRPAPATGRGLTGFSHGAAGVATALLELAVASGDPRFREAANRAFAYERAVYDDSVKNWPDFREDLRRETPGTPAFATSWCHGAPGIALSRVRAHELGLDPGLRAEAATAADTTARWVEFALSLDGTSYSLCHGLSGNAEIIGECAAISGEAATALVLRVASTGLENYAGRNLPFPSGANGGDTPSLFLGDAGVGRFYLRLVAPELPSLLLTKPESFSRGPTSPS